MYIYEVIIKDSQNFDQYCAGTFEATDYESALLILRNTVFPKEFNAISSISLTRFNPIVDDLSEDEVKFLRDHFRE